MTAVTVSSKGQLVLPSKIRDKLNLSAGDRVDLQIVDETIVLRPLKKSLSDLKGFLTKPPNAVKLEEMEEAISRSGHCK